MNRPLFILAAVCCIAAASVQLRHYRINYYAKTLPHSREFSFQRPCELYILMDPDRIVIDTSVFIVYGTATYPRDSMVYQCVQWHKAVTISMTLDTSRSYHYIMTVRWRDSAARYWAWPIEP